MELRPYQKQAIDNLRSEMRDGNRAVLLQAACGAGKTIVSADIVRSATEKGKRVLFLVNRRDLVTQTVEKYRQYGLGSSVGIIMAGEEPSLDMPIQVASLQTYGRRLCFDDPEFNAWFHHADLVIYDEAHSCNARTYRKIIDLYKDRSYIIGLSATPMRSDGTGLGTVFDSLVECIPTRELIDMGHLVPMAYYAPSKPDLERLKTVAGDYEKKELGKRVDQPKLIGDIYLNWLRLAGEKQTIIFATNVRHSKHIRDHFRAHNVSIEHIDAHTPDDERSDFYRRFESGDVQVMTNVGIATEGSDLPFVECVVLARPTKQLGRYIQMAGRGARPYPGKTKCILIDHAGCVEMHGFIEDDIHWTLNKKDKAAKKIKKREKKEPITLVCEKCTFAFQSERRCPQCGETVKDYGKKIEAIEAELVKVNGKKKTFTMDDKRRWYAMFDYERRRLGKSDKWLLAQYRSKFSVWPCGMDDVYPAEPNQEVLNWLKYQRIKWAKSKRKQECDTT